ncbi:DMT family transporter [Pelagovum pacificum]|uniref:DMT family transporter n=1 Tax=Pelagovum pacificum TaxID=2588711 RepID=A0A5C5GJ76_9RHOB|nr:DMT family transporter [Pelagovum pacificum]QQA42936.1 DMT family transporter [Pelagovum pacificum]TNY33921.1 DMT family transporter [Pelagovum pacificum]
MKLFALVALVMTAFAANSVLNRVAVAGGTDPVAFGAVRLLSGALLLALLARGRMGSAVRRPGRAASVAWLLVYIFGFSLAYRGLDTGLGALILFGCVQLTMFAAALLSREAVPATRWAGAGIALTGLVVLLWPGAAMQVGPGFAALMAGAGVGWGLYSLSGRKEADALAGTAVNFALAAPVGLAGWLLVGSTLPDATGIACAVASGAIASGLGYALWYVVLPRLAATTAAVAQLSVPIIAAAGGALILAEGVTLRFALATLLVLGGIAVSLRRPGRGG